MSAHHTLKNSDPDLRRLVERIRAHRCLSCVDPVVIAEHLLGTALSSGRPLRWVEAAIDRAAGEVVAAQAVGQRPSERAVAQTLVRFGSRPRRPVDEDDGDLPGPAVPTDPPPDMPPADLEGTRRGAKEVLRAIWGAGQRHGG